MVLECVARAKINVFLRVVGKREDGFHGLETLFVEVDLADRLCWSPSQEPLSLEVVGADVGAVEQNLVWRACKLFEQEAGINVTGSVVLHKNIPAGGGLGGGSSDAAAMLTLLNNHHQQPLSDEALAACALRLGSDVPFFLRGGCQLGTGRGEILEPVAMPECPPRGFLLLPGIHISTVAVFKAYASGIRNLEQASSEVGENHLLAAAKATSPAFAEVYDQMAALFGSEPFFMTGSGSTCVWLTEAVMPEDKARALQQLRVAFVPFQFHT